MLVRSGVSPLAITGIRRGDMPPSVSVAAKGEEELHPAASMTASRISRSGWRTGTGSGRVCSPSAYPYRFSASVSSRGRLPRPG